MTVFYFIIKNIKIKLKPVDSQGEKKELYVKGKSYYENAEPIIGATVSVKGSTTVQSLISMVSIPLRYPMEVHFGTHTSATVKKAS